MKKVSIIIPTYNRLDTLKRAIETCISQTYRDIEIIIVDDTEKSQQEMIDSYKDDRIVYVHNANPQGSPIARNLGIKHARGEYIAFLDDDDEWMPEKIEKQMAVMEKYPNCPLVICYSHDMRFGRDRINKPPETITHEIILKSFNLSSTSSYLVRRYAIEIVALEEGAKQFGREYDRIEDDDKEFKVFYDYEIGIIDSKKVKENYPRLYKIMEDKASFAFDIDLKSGQEYDLAIRLTMHNPARCVPEVLMKQYSTEGQISENWGRKIKGIMGLFAKHRWEFKSFTIKDRILQYVKTVGVLGLFFCGYFVGNKIYKIIIPAKEVYEH